MTATDRGRAPLAALWLASRLARRDVLRRSGRTALTALLIAVPAASMVVAAVFIRTEHRTPAEFWRMQYGAADAALSTSAGEAKPDVLEALPAGSRVVSYGTGYRLLKTRHGDRAAASVSDIPLNDPLSSGVFQVLRGRPPATVGEVFLTRRTATQLAVDVGDTLELVRPVEVSLAVVGVGERRAWWGSEVAVVASATALASPKADGGMVYAIDLPAGYDPTPLVENAEALHVEVAPRYGLGSVVGPGERSQATGKVAWSWVVGALALVVVGIVITCAFAAGARRQLTTMGQLAANGASPAVLRAVLVLQGAWTGVIGVAAGLVLAAAALVALAPHMDRLLSRDVDPYTIHGADLLPVAVLGIAASSLAALVPARSIGAVPVLAALAGRRPLRPVPGWLIPAGAALGGAGLALLALAVLGANTATTAHSIWALAAILGSVAVLLGACTVAPGYVRVLGPIATRMHGARRFAARSLMRQRTRTAAVVSAICATAALTVAAGALYLGAAEKFAAAPQYMPANQVHVSSWHIPEPDPETGEVPPSVIAEAPAELLDDIDAALDADRYRLTVLAPSQPGPVWNVTDHAATESDAGHADRLAGDRAVLADKDAAAVYGLTDQQIEAAHRTGALLIGDFSTPTATVRWTPPQGLSDKGTPTTRQPAAQRSVTAATARGKWHAPGGLPTLILSQVTAEDLGLAPAPGPVAFINTADLTDAQRAKLTELSEDLHAAQLDQGTSGTQISIAWQAPSGDVPPLLLESILTGTTLILTLAIVAVSLGLASAETRDERDALAVVGASPGTLVGMSGHKAVFLSLLGVGLALPVGLLPVSVFTAISDADIPLVLPWRTIALLTTAVPAAVAAAAVGGSLLSTRLRPTRVSTMAFE